MDAARLLALLLLASALAGCSSSGAGAPSSEEVPGLTGGALNATAMPDGMLPGLPDLWEGRTEVVLIDADFQAGASNGMPGCLGTPALSYSPCAYAVPEPGHLVLPGSGAMVVEVTAGPGAGAFFAEIATRGRNGDVDTELSGDPTSEEAGTWTFPLVAADWDRLSSGTSAVVVEVWSEGPAGARQGAFHVTATLLRDPAWMAEPVPDPWLGSSQRIGSDGFLVEDTVVTAQHGNYAVAVAESFTSGGTGSAFDLTPAHPVADSASHLLLALAWDGAFPGCNESLGPCDWALYAYRGDTYLGMATLASADAQVSPAVYRFNASTYPADKPGATSSEILFQAYAGQCDPALTAYNEAMGFESTCSAQLQDMPPTQVRVRIESWRTEPDLDAFVARLAGSA